ncbi:MAG TPA: hypothetical protein VLA32_11395 [Anaerolineales bacterium]|jgi:hypothetical protein|nr:hypothetical protein [Anaerolineales bacterium]
MNKFLKYLFVLIFIAIIVVIAMQFMTPNIPYFCTNMSLADFCHLQRFEERCTNNWERFLTGKLVLILPKTMKNQMKILGYYYSQIQVIGFAYSPSVYSRGEINDIQQQFLRELNLREYEVKIVKFDILMDVNGYPRIHITCGPQTNRFEASYSKGENLFIDPSGLTVWRFPFEIKNLEPGSLPMNIEFVHDDPGLENAYNDPCGSVCEKVAGIVSIKLQNKLSIWDRIQAIWFFYPPLGSIFLFSLIGWMIVLLVRKRIQRIRANQSLE